MAIWSRLTTFIGGGAVATAAADGARPVLEPVRQHAWQRNKVRVLDPGTVARMVAQAIVDETEAVKEAGREGYNENRLQALIHLAQVAPALSEARALRRRGRFDKDTLHRVYAKEQIGPQYWDDLDALVVELLDPGQLAAAIHRGLVPDPTNPATGEKLLRGEQPQPPFNVEPYPVYPIDAAAEAAGSGYDIDRLGVLVGLQGLPMGVIEAAQAFYRHIITHGDYVRAFNESNSRNEWAQAVLEYAKQIPTARDFIENALRGYRTLDEAKQGAALHGMSPEHAELIFENSGRAMNLHQITQALAWGASYNPRPADDPDPYVQSTLIGPIQPAYYELNEALKYTLPSGFYFRALQESGVLSQPQAERWYLRLGWPPELATLVSNAFDKAGAGKADPWVTKAANHLWTETQKAYIKGTVAQPQAADALTTLGVDDAAQVRIFALWGETRGITGAA